MTYVKGVTDAPKSAKTAMKAASRFCAASVNCEMSKARASTIVPTLGMTKVARSKKKFDVQ